MIHILFQTQSHYPVNRKKLIAGIQKELEFKVHRDAEVSVSIVGDRRMRQLNKKFRSLDKTTDVLSFPLHDSTQASSIDFIESPDNVLRLGDIVISYPQAISEARQFNKMVDDIILMLALHGLNHLLGIHHPE